MGAGQCCLAFDGTKPWQLSYLAFSPAFRARLVFYKANGISVIFVRSLETPVAYANSTTNPHNSTNAAAFGRFAEEMARRMKASKVPFVLELGKEPHNFSLGFQIRRSV